MSEMQKKELDFETLDSAVGGNAGNAGNAGFNGNAQETKNGSMGIQQKNKNGNNNIYNNQKQTQFNNVQNNTGEVKVGGPINIETGKNNVMNINIG